MKHSTKLLAIALCFASGITAHAQTSQLVYSQNFNSAATDTTGTGLNDGSNIVDNSASYNARVFDSTQWGTVPSGPTWRSLWLTSMSTGIISNFFMPVTNSGQYVSSFSANFTLLINYINRTNEAVADGFSINFGKFNNTTSPYGGEAGMYSSPTNTGNVLNLSWNTYGGGTPTIQARYNGVTIATGAQAPVINTGNPPPASAFLPVNFSWDSNGLDMTYNGSSVFNNLSIPGFAPDIDYSFAMAARTGAAYENLFVDDIAINTTVSPFTWTGGSGNWTTGGNWTIGSAPTTNNNWIVMAGSGGNSNNNAVSAMQGLVFSSNATGSYTLTGNAFTLGADGIVNNSSSAQTISSAITLNASQTFNAANSALTVNGSINAGSNALTIQGANNVALNGAVSGSGGSLAKSGAGTLTLAGANTHSGATSIQAGGLKVSGSIGNSTVTVNGSGTLSGSGSVRGLIIDDGGTVTPGNSPGTLTVTGNSVWLTGGSYDWETASINSNPAVQISAGTSWDLLDIGGTLTFSGLGGSNLFNLNLSTLSDGINSGTLPGWDPAVGSTWLIASADSGIFVNAGLVTTNTNYSSFFNINSTGWSGALPSSFQVVTLGSTTDLYLQSIGSAAAPEPGQVAASVLLLAGIGGYVFLKRRKIAKATVAA